MIWKSYGVLYFPPNMRQEHLKLFAAVQVLKNQLEKSAVVYVVVQNGEYAYLPYKIAYSLLPVKTLNLPHRWIATDGPSRTLRVRYFENSLVLAQYLKEHKATHLLVVSGDSIASLITDLPLTEDRMYLIRFESDEMKFVKVCDVPVP